MATATTKSPLNDRHYQDLKRIQKSAKATLEFLSKCEKCQLDVEAEITATKQQLDVIQKLLREFFPERPE